MSFCAAVPSYFHCYNLIHALYFSKSGNNQCCGNGCGRITTKAFTLMQQRVPHNVFILRDTIELCSMKHTNKYETAYEVQPAR